MFRHVVVLTWKPGTTEQQVEAFSAGLDALRRSIPGLLDYRYGPDAGLAEGNGDYAIVAEFATAEDYLVYRDHPEHRAFMERHLVPMAAARTAVQHTA